LLEIWYNFKGNNLVEIWTVCPADDIKLQIASSCVCNNIKLFEISDKQKKWIYYIDVKDSSY